MLNYPYQIFLVTHDLRYPNMRIPRTRLDSMATTIRRVVKKQQLYHGAFSLTTLQNTILVAEPKWSNPIELKSFKGSVSKNALLIRRDISSDRLVRYSQLLDIDSMGSQFVYPNIKGKPL